MGEHMKTTVEVPDPVLDAAKVLARREGITVKALIERGLRRELEIAEAGQQFKLRRASFRGKGLRQDQPDVSWERLRELAYADRDKP
jgi:hypothetical protein